MQFIDFMFSNETSVQSLWNVYLQKYSKIHSFILVGALSPEFFCYLQSYILHAWKHIPGATLLFNRSPTMTILIQPPAVFKVTDPISLLSIASINQAGSKSSLAKRSSSSFLHSHKGLFIPLCRLFRLTSVSGYLASSLLHP